MARVNNARRLGPVFIALGLVGMIGSTTVNANQQTKTPPSAEEIQALKTRLDALDKEAAAIRQALEGLPPEAPSPSIDEPESPALENRTTAGSATTVAPAEGTPEAPIVETDQPPVEIPAPPPIPVVSGAAGKNFLNLSLDGLFAAGSSTARDVGALETGGHDPAQRGFTVQNVEAVLQGAVDPYFQGQANIVLQITPEGETLVELEEAYATTTSLPKGLQVKAGQFFTEFGRLNPQHPHSWDFVDQPLVNGRFLGPDGLRAPGVRVSWLVPTSFYSEAFVALQNSQGETLNSFRSVPGETLFGRTIQERTVSSFSDLLIVPRYTASFDLSDTKTLLLGGSAALGPNGTGDSGRTRIYGLDGFFKWKPSNAFQGFPFVKIQGEVMRRSASVAGVPNQAAAATFKDWGGYMQVNWGYKAGHVLGFRVDQVGGDQGDPHDDALAPRLRLSPALTWFPTEYSKLRLQYNFDRSDAFRNAQHSVWLQLEFLLGAHAAHKF